MYSRAVALALVVLSQLANASPEAARRVAQIALVKHWALSRCLAKVYVESAVRNDANASASAYLEAGDLPIEVYDAVDHLANKYANRKYGGSIESEFGTKKCIDFFESNALRDLAAKLVDSNPTTR